MLWVLVKSIEKPRVQGLVMVTFDNMSLSPWSNLCKDHQSNNIMEVTSKSGKMQDSIFMTSIEFTASGGYKTEPDVYDHIQRHTKKGLTF